MVPFFIFLLGLAIGSFLNCLVWRLKNGESWRVGHSHCPHCRHTLRWYELIPVVSFFWQKGRCNYCGQSISWQYPLVELATAGLFLLAYWQIPAGLAGAAGALFLLRHWFFVSILLTIFVFDLRYYLIPDQLSLSAIIIAFFTIPLISAAPIFNWHVYALGFISGIIGGGFFLLQYLISKGKWIGAGDIRLGILMGFLLGWQGLLLALSIAYVVGALVGLILVASKQKQWQSAVPFGPFLAGATIIILLFGQEILAFYEKFFIG